MEAKQKFTESKNLNQLSKTKPENKSLRLWLQNTLTYKQYTQLFLALKVTKYKATSIINNPELMELHEIKLLSKAVGQSPYFLVSEFNAGTLKLTISEFQSLKQNDN